MSTGMLRSCTRIGPERSYPLTRTGARGGSTSVARVRVSDRVGRIGGRGEAHGGIHRSFQISAVLPQHSPGVLEVLEPGDGRERGNLLILGQSWRHPGSGLRRARVSPESGFRSGNALENACVSPGPFEQPVDHPARYGDRARSDLVATFRDLIPHKGSPGTVSDLIAAKADGGLRLADTFLGGAEQSRTTLVYVLYLKMNI